MLESDHYYYFDSHEIEKIIDYYIENDNKAKIRELLIFMKNYILFITFKNKKAQTLLYFGKAFDAYDIIQSSSLIMKNIYTLASIYSKLMKTKSYMIF